MNAALAAILKSLELKSDNPDAHMNLSQIYKDLGQLDQALAAALKSLELKPDNPDAQTNLGGILLRRGKHNEGLKELLAGEGVIVFDLKTGVSVKGS